ncbi:MAG TPA: adenine phosphoribosyltransferase [Planctomycetaceae bacterium]|nr:adenine phosphoribosyltransferase [Planctomycetaceae bacterium]
MSETTRPQLTDFIRSIPDFPKPGILFRDITPLLASPEALAETVRRLADRFRDARIDLVAAAEARGFLFAVPLAVALGAGVVPIRKPGKLPHGTVSETYELEYGTDTLEMHDDAVSPGDRVLVLDDLLATGGTVAACCRMIEKAGGTVVGCAFVIELAELGGAKKLAGYDVFSLVQY